MNELEKEFVLYQEALALKELGFDEPCYAYFDYNQNLVYTGIVSQNKNSFWVINEIIITAPTYSQAFRWFREKYNLDSFVKHLYKSTIKVGYYFGVDGYKRIDFQMDLDDYYKTHEEAELACLRKLIEITKKAE